MGIGDRSADENLAEENYLAHGRICVGVFIVAAIVESEPSRILASVLAGASCGAVFFIIYYIYPEGMGFGDVRLVALNGLAVGWFGISAAWVSLALGFVLAFPLSVWFLIRHGVRKGLKVESPFGPSWWLGQVWLHCWRLWELLTCLSAPHMNTTHSALRLHCLIF